MRPDLEIDAEEFIAVKGFKAKGKRITTYQLGEITELEPLRQPEPESAAQSETIDAPEDDSEEVADLSDKSDLSDSLTGLTSPTGQTHPALK